jgi:hypothetical protein
MCRPLAEPVGGEGIVTFKRFGWGPQRYKSEYVIKKLQQRLRPGKYLATHLAADDRLVLDWLRTNKVPVVVITRDPRDILVSMAYHAASTNPTRKHPRKAAYQMLPNSEKRMLGAIRGVGDEVGFRAWWEPYVGWLQQRWVQCVPFEKAITEPLSVAYSIIKYISWRRNGDETEDDLLWWAALMVDGINPATSPTFRKGTAGQWRDEFTPAVTAAFKEAMGDWLITLGYEPDNAW